MLTRCLIAIAAVTLASCSSVDARREVSGACLGERIIEVTVLADSDLYRWNEGEISSTQLRSALEAEDKSCPVSEIRLLRGDREITIANCIEIVDIADAIGAKAQYEHVTLGFKPIVRFR